jgi:purine-binding chemotaxis protein CheW
MSAVSPKHLLFRTGRDFLAVPLEHVVRIVPYVAPSRLPGTPAHVRGVAQLQGKMMPIVDVAQMHGGEPVQPGPYTVLVVVEHARAISGVLADEVIELVDLAAAQRMPPAASGLDVMALGERVILAIDVALTLDVRRTSTPQKTTETRP